MEKSLIENFILLCSANELIKLQAHAQEKFNKGLLRTRSNI